MTEQAILIDSEGEVEAEQATGTIDLDVHPLMAGPIGTLFPYMTRSWQQRMSYAKDTPFLPAPQLGRAPHWKRITMREDATPPTGGPAGSDVEFVRVHHLDAHNIETAMLVPLAVSLVSNFTVVDEAAVLVAAFNDYFMEHWLEVDDRFRLSMVISPHDPVSAAAEIRRLGEDQRVSSVFFPLINRLPGERFFYPIYEAAGDMGLPVVFHPNGLESDAPTALQFAGGVPEFRAERNSTFSEFGMSTLASLIYQGVFERYTELKVLLIEFGWSWVAPFTWRMDDIWRAGRVSVPWVRRLPSEYVAQHVRFGTQPGLEIPSQKYLAQIVDMMDGANTLVFSSDYPHWDADDPELPFRSLPDATQRRVLRTNAAEFVGSRATRSPNPR